MLNHGFARLCVVIGMFFLGGLSFGGEEYLNGKLTVEGMELLHSAMVGWSYSDGRSSRASVAADGSFKTDILRGQKGEVLITPVNESVLCGRSEQDTLLIGFLKFDPSKTSEILLQARTVPVVTRKVQVLDGDGRAVAKVIVSVKAQISMGAGKDAPMQTISIQLSTDADGVFSIKTPDGIASSYSLSISTLGPDEASIDGKLEISGAELAAHKEGKPCIWKVTREQVSLEVHTQWDPDYSNEDFPGNARKSITAHTVGLKGIPGSGALIEKDGVARFYDVKPGKYELEFPYKSGKDTYRITRNSANVVISENASLPVKHTLIVMPVIWHQLSGKVMDADNNRAIAGAMVTVETSSARTGLDGTFIIKVPTDTATRLHLEADEYFPAEFLVEKSTGKGLPNYSMKRYPEVSGRVIFKDSEEPLPRCTLEWDGRIHSRVSTNEQGRFVLRLAPGNYDVSVSSWHMAGPEPRDKHKIMMFRGAIEVGKDGYNGNFIVPPMVEISLNIGVADTVRKTGAPAFIWLLRSVDNRIMAGGKYTAERPIRVFAVSGQYKVVVGVDEQHGALLGTLDTGDRKQLDAAFEVQAWQEMSLDRDGSIVRFVGKESAQKNASDSKPEAKSGDMPR